MTTTDEIAAGIRDGYARGGLVGAFEFQGTMMADTVEVRHVPAQPTDGMREGHVQATFGVESMSALQAAIPDLSHQAEVSTTGDEIRFTMILTGTVGDGGRLNHTFVNCLTVKDGNIVTLVFHSPPGGDQLLMKALGIEQA